MMIVVSVLNVCSIALKLSAVLGLGIMVVGMKIAAGIAVAVVAGDFVLFSVFSVVVDAVVFAVVLSSTLELTSLSTACSLSLD